MGFWTNDREEAADPWSFEAYLWLPTVDHEPPHTTHLHMGIAFLRQCERAKLLTLVHYTMGVGRSATMVLAGQLRDTGTQDALDFILMRQVEAAETAARTYEE